MRFIMRLFGWPLGWLMWAMYQVVHSYGWAIILFTIVTKLLLIPLAIKQQKSTVKMQIIQPKMQEIQNKYKNNPQKMNEELQALYERENYSMTAGCLPMLIQFPIIFGLLDVIYRPLTHLLHISGEAMTQVTEIATGLIGTAATGGYAPEIAIMNSVKANPAAYAALGSDLISHIQSLDMNFLGLDLSVFPNQVIHFGLNAEAMQSLLNPIILIPLLSGGTALLMSLVTMRNTPSAGGANASMNAMMLMMPLMSLWFTFMVPAGVGLYWTMSNVVAVGQSMVMNHFWNPKEIAEKMKAEEEARKERERQEKIEAKKRAKEEGKVEEEAALSKKEQDRRRLAEARKRNAEKYGDTYVEVTDDDLK